jgi:hypothetical protein
VLGDGAAEGGEGVEGGGEGGEVEAEAALGVEGAPETR